LTIADTDLSQAFSGPQDSSGRPEALEVVERLGDGPTGTESNPVGEQFDSSLSFGQTRAAFESEFERRYVSWLLERQHGNVSAAAREARMDRKYLHVLAKKHGLRGPGATGQR
jgi:DNA-binding NtrC family response regulator